MQVVVVLLLPCIHESHVVLYTTMCNDELMLFISSYVFVYMKWYDSKIEPGSFE